MKKMLLIGFFLCLFGFVKAQQAMILNPNDSQCVVKAYTQLGGLRGNIKTVVVSIDDGKKYYYEYNWKTRTGYNGQKISWEKDVMQIAYDACKNGRSLENVGFKSYEN